MAYKERNDPPDDCCESEADYQADITRCEEFNKKGDNMEKTVRITGFEEKEGLRGAYWKVSTSPALIPKKALFIHDEGQVQALETDKHYNFVFSTNEKGFINIESFEEVIDIHEDTPEPKTTQQTGDNKGRSFALSYAKDAVKEYYSARITSGAEVPNVDKMGKDIMAMGDDFLGWLNK